MQSSSLKNALALWPHLLTPTVFLLFFTLPPFRYRQTLLTVFTLVMTYFCLLKSSPQTGEISTPRFGLVSMWMFYIGWLGKMLFYTPEHDFWRKGKPPHEAETMSFGWAKFKWALSLLLSWRGVGWNIEPKRLPAPRPKVGRWRFVTKEVVRAGFYYILTDAATTFIRRNHFIHESDRIKRLNWVRRAALEMACGGSAWWMLEYQFAVYGAALVAVGIYGEEDFLPLFGDITNVHSLGDFWGQFWHQNCRLIFTDYSRAVARFLRIPHRSELYWLVHVWTAFLMSGVLHSLPSWSLPAVKPFDGVYERFTALFIFFALQAVGLTLEAVFFVSPAEDVLLYEVGRPDVWIMGRLWTLSWLLFTGEFALECYLKTEQGMLRAPFSFFI